VNESTEKKASAPTFKRKKIRQTNGATTVNEGLVYCERPPPKKKTKMHNEKGANGRFSKLGVKGKKSVESRPYQKKKKKKKAKFRWDRLFE